MNKILEKLKNKFNGQYQCIVMDNHLYLVDKSINTQDMNNSEVIIHSDVILYLDPEFPSVVIQACYSTTPNKIWETVLN